MPVTVSGCPANKKVSPWQIEALTVLLAELGFEIKLEVEPVSANPLRVPLILFLLSISVVIAVLFPAAVP